MRSRLLARLVARPTVTARWSVLALALLVAPMVVVLGRTVAGFVVAGYWDDVPGGLTTLLAIIAPALLLGFAVVRTSRRSGEGLMGAISGCAVYGVLTLVAYVLYFADRSSTAGLLFIWVIPLQLIIALATAVVALFAVRPAAELSSRR